MAQGYAVGFPLRWLNYTGVTVVWCGSICHPRTNRSVRRGRPPREEVYARLEYQIDALWQRMGGLPDPLEAADIWQGIWFEEAHHSTAIEGNTLALKQVEALLAEGRAVGDKELREYMEVKGYADAAVWVQPGDPTRGLDQW